MIRTAVILAAGLGSRLKERTKLQPKGFLELEGISLIERSVNVLLHCGIKNIYIGTGYLSDFYDNFAKKYTAQKDICIKTIKSDKFDTTSSMYTLYNMRNILTEDFLLLESDLLYERKAISCLLEDKTADIILASGMTNSEDEVYIETDSHSNLVNLSKHKVQLASVDAELVGISKISLNRYKMLNLCFEAVQEQNPKADYEHMFVKSIKQRAFYVKKIEGLLWCEIDDENHLERALNTILPQIQKG